MNDIGKNVNKIARIFTFCIFLYSIIPFNFERSRGMFIYTFVNGNNFYFQTNFIFTYENNYF